MAERRPWPIPFLDLSNTLFFFFVGLFALALLIIGDEQTKAKVDTTSKLLIHLTWGDNSPNDVDLWLKNPADHIVSFRDKSADYASLDQDNTGSAEGVVTDASGNVVSNPLRDEVIYIRQTMAGTYTVNVHFYAQYSTQKEEPVAVTLTSVEPSYRVIMTRKLVLTEKREEHTAFRFTVDDKGNVTSTDTVEDLFANATLAGE